MVNTIVLLGGLLKMPESLSSQDESWNKAGSRVQNTFDIDLISVRVKECYSEVPVVYFNYFL